MIRVRTGLQIIKSLKMKNLQVFEKIFTFVTRFTLYHINKAEKRQKSV